MPQWFMKGGPVMYPLILCSVVSLTFVIERIIFWFVDMRNMDTTEVDDLLAHLRRGGVSDFLRFARKAKNPISQTLCRALRNGQKTLSEALSLEIDTTVEKTRRSLTVIDTCVTLAPLLGIFGTVTGIIQSFELMGAGGGVSDPIAVSAGIAEALITTATGLVIAMISLIFFNYFAARSERFTFRLETYAREFEILFAQLGPLKSAEIIAHVNAGATARTV